MKVKKDENLLFVVYISMVLLCIYLNVFTKQAIDFSNLFVNIGLFLIAGLIFAHAIFRCFYPINDVMMSLNFVRERMRRESEDKNCYLWDTYKEEKELFQNQKLDQLFFEYQKEMNRLSNQSAGAYQCDIEDYLNKELIDGMIQRNLLNLVPGVMTGLGILGTFIGLSFGLQHFSTGTTQEISDSIAPLMDGIKVAFHTSIYGMVFSLFFHYIFKKKLEDASNTMYDFLNDFRKYVVPDNENEVINRILLYQKQQVEGLSNMTDSIANQMANRIGEVMTKEFDRMNQSMDRFVEIASEQQVQGVQAIVHQFVTSMQEVLGEHFQNLLRSIEHTSELQMQNSDSLKHTIIQMDDATKKMQEINQTSLQILNDTMQYIGQVNQLNQAMVQLNQSNEKTMMLHNDISEKQQNQLVQLEEMSKDMIELGKQQSDAIVLQMQQMKNLSNSLSNELNDSSDRLEKVAISLNKQLIESLNRTFETFDENLAEITSHLSATITEIDATSSRVPNIIATAYETMEHEFKNIQFELDGLIHAIDILRRNADFKMKQLEFDE